MQFVLFVACVDVVWAQCENKSQRHHVTPTEIASFQLLLRYLCTLNVRQTFEVNQHTSNCRIRRMHTIRANDIIELRHKIAENRSRTHERDTRVTHTAHTHAHYVSDAQTHSSTSHIFA